MILGVILYGGVGLVSIYYDAEYLNYSILARTKHGQHIGILLIEFGVGLTVAGVMFILFIYFHHGKVKINDTVYFEWNYWIAYFNDDRFVYSYFKTQSSKKMVGLTIFQTSVFLFYISLGKVQGGTALFNWI